MNDIYDAGHWFGFETIAKEEEPVNSYLCDAGWIVLNWSATNARRTLQKRLEECQDTQHLIVGDRFELSEDFKDMRGALLQRMRERGFHIARISQLDSISQHPSIGH